MSVIILELGLICRSIISFLFVLLCLTILVYPLVLLEGINYLDIFLVK